MKRKTQTAFFFLFGGLISSALACSTLAGSGSAPASSDDSHSSSSPSSDNLPEKTYLGDYISYDGYYFAVLQVVDPAPNSANAVSGQGMRDVALEAVAGNQSGGFFSPITTSFGGLGDGGDQVFGAEPFNSGAGIPFDLMGYFDRGERVRGWMVFSMPKTMKPLTLKIDLLNPAGGWIPFQYGLTPPPDGYAPLRLDTSGKQPERAAFGKAAEKKGYSLKVLQVKDNLDSIPGLYMHLPPDSRVMGVQIEIRNKNESTMLIEDLSLSDVDGMIYRMKGSEIIQPQGKLLINPREDVRDWIYFVVPSDASMDVIRLVCNIYADPEQDVVLRSALS
jgi:hypothetical protein